MLRNILAKVTDSKRTPRTCNRHSKCRRALAERLEDRTLLAADFALDVTDGDMSVEAGETVVYSFEYSNVGDAAGDAVLRTWLPRHATLDAKASDSAWSCEDAWFGMKKCLLDVGAVGPEATGSAALAVIVDSDISDRVSRISVSGSISGDSLRRDRNDRDHESTPIERELHDLRVDLSDGDADVKPGGTVAYTIDYANNGSVDATGVVVTVRVSRHATVMSEGTDWNCENGRCTLEIGNVAAGQSGSVKLEVTVDSELSSRRRALYALGSIHDDGENGRDGDYRDNYSFSRTLIVDDEPDDGGDPPTDG